jgi:hypothetical protein
MRGLWDQEQTLTPALLKSAMLLLGVLLGVLAAANVVVALRLLIGGAWISAIAQLASGLAVPFAIWLGVRILLDVLTLQHRSLDRFEAISEGLTLLDPQGPAAAQAAAPPTRPADSRPADSRPADPRPSAPRPADAPAADDGVAYPQD